MFISRARPSFLYCALTCFAIFCRFGIFEPVFDKRPSHHHKYLQMVRIQNIPKAIKVLTALSVSRILTNRKDNNII